MNAIDHIQGKRFIVLMIICFAIPAQETMCQTLQSLIEKTGIGDMAVQSFSGTVSYEWVKVDSLHAETLAYREELGKEATHDRIPGFPNVIKKTATLYSMTPKLRTDIIYDELHPNGEIVKVEETNVYNGEITTLYRRYYYTRLNKISHRGNKYPDNKLEYRFYDPIHNGMTISGSPVSELLQGNTSGALTGKFVENITVLGGETVEGTECIPVQVDCNDGYTVTMWIAPDKMYRPLKYIRIGANSTVNTSVKYAEYSPGIWFPKEITSRIHIKNKTDGKLRLSVITTITIHDGYELNPYLDDDVFTFSYPSGTNIIDEITGETYTVFNE